jgi:AAA domain
MLWGEAGTGKSHTLNATRAAYEAEGIGLSWTNDVVQQMRGDGGGEGANRPKSESTVETRLISVRLDQAPFDNGGERCVRAAEKFRAINPMCDFH